MGLEEDLEERLRGSDIGGLFESVGETIGKGQRVSCEKIGKGQELLSWETVGKWEGVGGVCKVVWVSVGKGKKVVVFEVSKSKGRWLGYDAST